MKFYHMTLLLLPMLLFVVGCGDSVEDSEANILDPNSADPHFQNLPLAGGSLIPLDEIPVVTIEKTREDDDFYYWQLKADPVPIHEDMVVGISLYLGQPWHYHKVKLKNLVDRSGKGLKDQEVTLGSNYNPIHGRMRTNIYTRLNNEGYFPNYKWYLPYGEAEQLVVVIPKRQNTSQEFKLPLSSSVLDENQHLELWILAKELEEFTDNEDVIKVNGEVVEDVIWDITYTLEIKPFWNTARWIVRQKSALIDDLFQTFPIFQTFEGYIIREGFALSYYMLGESSALELKPPTDPE